VGSVIFYNDKIAGHACVNVCGLRRVFARAKGASDKFMAWQLHEENKVYLVNCHRNCIIPICTLLVRSQSVLLGDSC